MFILVLIHFISYADQEQSNESNRRNKALCSLPERNLILEVDCNGRWKDVVLIIFVSVMCSG